MNWRRGLNRLFLILSAVWLIAAIWLSAIMRDNARRSEYRKVHDGMVAARELSPVLRDAEGNILPKERLSARQKLEVIRAEEEQRKSAEAEGSQLRVPKGFVLTSVDQRKSAEAERSLQLATATLERNLVLLIFTPPILWDTLALMFIPPVVVYLAVAVGFLAVRWIVRGFRETVGSVSE